MNYSPKEFDKKLEEICKELKRNKDLKEKKAYLLGGQSGSGKSTISIVLMEKNNNIILINGDEFRQYHPNFNELNKTYGKDSITHTQEFAGKMTEAVIEKLSNDGYSLIIEGTLRTADIPLKTENLLEEKGYRVELCVMQVRPEKSFLGTLERYEKMISSQYETPRHTPKEHHDLIVSKIVGNLDTLYKSNSFDDIKLYNRDGEILYSMKETPDINPSKIMEKEFKRNLTSDEVKELVESCNLLEKNMIKRNAPKEELKVINDLKLKIIENSPMKATSKNKIKIKNFSCKTLDNGNDNEL